MRIRSHSSSSLNGFDDPKNDHKEMCPNVKLKGYMRNPCGERVDLEISNPDFHPHHSNEPFNRTISLDSFDTVATTMTHCSSAVSFSSLKRDSRDHNNLEVVVQSKEENLFDNLQIKDTGYAWIVLAAMFFSNMLTTGYMKGFGVFFNEIKEEYPAASGLMAGIMMGLLSGFRTIFAPFAGALATTIGIRRTLGLGATLYTVALFSSYFCTNLEQLSITLGALIGISHCLIESVQVIIVSQYFESKLSLANGIRVGGNPCGGILFPLLLTQLYASFGLKLLMIILSGVTMHIFVLTALMRPFKVHFKINALDETNKILKEKSKNNNKEFSQKFRNLLEGQSLRRVKKENEKDSFDPLSSISSLQTGTVNPLQLSTSNLFSSMNQLKDNEGFNNSSQIDNSGGKKSELSIDTVSYIYKEPTISTAENIGEKKDENKDLTDLSKKDTSSVAHLNSPYEEQYCLTKKELYTEIVKHNKHLLKDRPKKKFNLGCFKNPHYLLFICMASLIPMGNPLVLYYTTLYAKNSIALSRTEINLLLSFQAIFDFCLRFFLGWLNNKNLYKKSNGFVFCLLLSSIGSIIMHFGKTLLPLMLTISLYTFGPASFHVFVNVMLTERFGKEKIASTWGFVRMTQGIFSFIHPILIGYLLDSTGSYVIPFTVMGTGMFLCGIFIFADNFLGLCSFDKMQQECQVKQ